MEILIAVGVGFILDLIFGDPHWLPHPICFIGFIIKKTEFLLRKIFPPTSRSLIVAGVILNIIVLTISFLLPFFILYISREINPILKIVVESIFCYQIIATKSLKTESMRVHKYLVLHDIENSRKYLSWIVGRDTQELTEEQIAKGAIETVAENTCDGVVAPLIYMMIGGAPLGFMYKAINTLDSMVGYKNEKYLYFGKFSAKVDDVANFIPAIISAFLMMISSFFLGYDTKNAMRIFSRDRLNHASPNSAKTESVCAGALQIQLAGDAYYFGVLHKKKTIGDRIKKVEADDIARANSLMYITAMLCFLLVWAVRFLVVTIC